MPIIKPSSELRNNYPEMIKLAKESRQPLFLTKNGTGEAVLLSMEQYDETYRMLELYEQLAVGEDDLKAGRTKTLTEVSKLMKTVIAGYAKD